LATHEKNKGCKAGTIAFNRMKETFGRYIRRIPVAYNAQGEETGDVFPFKKRREQ